MNSSPPPAPQGQGENPLTASEFYDLTARELLALYSRVITELVRRRVVRSRNAPAGDYSELLVAEHYGGELAPQSEKSFDVVVAGGRRLQVKARVVAEEDRRSHSFSPFRSFDFDACVFLVLDSVNYLVREAREIPMEVVASMATDVKWVNGKRVSVRQVLAQTDDATDLAEGLRAAAQRVDETGTDGRVGQVGRASGY